MPRVVDADTAIPLMFNPLILCDLACVSALCIREGAGGATVETLGRDGSIRATDKAGGCVYLWRRSVVGCLQLVRYYGRLLSGEVAMRGVSNFLSPHACRTCVSVVCVCVLCVVLMIHGDVGWCHFGCSIVVCGYDGVLFVVCHVLLPLILPYH